MSKNNQPDATMFFITVVAAVFVFIGWKIHKTTGLSFDALASVGKNLLLFFGVLIAAIFLKIEPIKRYWNWVLSALWLTLIPAFNEWGKVSEFRNFERVTEIEWYAQTEWQLAVAIALVASKYIYDSML